jgi:hypothetical protein
VGWVKRRIIESMEPTEYELAGRWIPVDERLPDEGGPVLASNGKDVTVCVYRESTKWWRHLDDYFSWRPTHWMPLPAPPTDAK